MLERLRRRVDRVKFFANVFRSTGLARPVRPASIAQFVNAARQSSIGPHLAVMFHAAAHPDRDALVEYGEHGVKRLTWGEFDAPNPSSRG